MKVVSQLLKASEQRECTGHLVVEDLHCQEGTRGMKLSDCSMQEGVNPLARLGDGQGRTEGTGLQVDLGYLFPAPGTLTSDVGHARACASLREFSREINLPKGGSICEQPIRELEW